MSGCWPFRRVRLSNLALKSDGTVIAKGDNYSAEAILPAGSGAKSGQVSLTCSPKIMLARNPNL